MPAPTFPQKPTRHRIVSLIALIALMIAPAAHSGEPAQLVEREPGVFWYQAGDDGKSAYDFAADLSFEGRPRFVVFIATEKAYEAKAVAHAKSLASQFSADADIPGTVPVVVFPWNKSGIAYIYYMYGYSFRHPELAPNGIMNVQASNTLVQKAIRTFLARQYLYTKDPAEFEFAIGR